jgi:hypothetical protein
MLKPDLVTVTGLNVRSISEEVVDMRNLPSGIYFVAVKTSHGSITKRVIKE